MDLFVCAFRMFKNPSGWDVSHDGREKKFDATANPDNFDAHTPALTCYPSICETNYPLERYPKDVLIDPNPVQCLGLSALPQV